MIICSEHIRNHPVVLMIEERLSKSRLFDFGENQEFLGEILQSSFVRDVIKIELRNALKDDKYQLRDFTMEGGIRGWRVLSSDQLSISIGLRRSEIIRTVQSEPLYDLQGFSQKIQAYPTDLFLGFVKVDSLDITRYESVQQDEAGERYELSLVSRKRIQSGDSVLLRAGTDLMVSELHGAALNLEIGGAVKYRMLPQFELRTLKMAGWISCDPGSSRLELLTRTLAELGYVEGLPLLEQVSQHQDHFVRWDAIRQILRLDRELGLRAVRRALNDTSGEVRLAAVETLERFASQ